MAKEGGLKLHIYSRDEAPLCCLSPTPRAQCLGALPNVRSATALDCIGAALLMERIGSGPLGPQTPSDAFCLKRRKKSSIQYLYYFLKKSQQSLNCCRHFSVCGSFCLFKISFKALGLSIFGVLWHNEADLVSLDV